MKKLLAFCLALTMVLGLMAVTAQADEPIEILFWSTRKSGANLTVVEHEVETFNETIGKELGIHVTHEPQGGYPEIWAALSTAAGNVAPDVVALGNTYIPYALGEDMLADMAPLAAADNYELAGNLMSWVLDIKGNTDGGCRQL